MSQGEEFTYRKLLPSCRLVVTIMACFSCVSGLFAGYLFIITPTNVSDVVKIVWATSAAIYALVSLLVIIGVWKLIKWPVYLYMSMLLVAIAVYSEILSWLWNSLPPSVFVSVVISFIFLGLALNITKTITERRRLRVRE